MPLTLSAVMAAMPETMGFGFGLTTLFLFLGCAPLYALPDNYKAPVPVLLASTLGAAFLLFSRCTKNRCNRRKPGRV